MAKLITASRFADPDAAYAALLAAHRGLDGEASVMLNAKLVLILANHIGDFAVLEEAIALAKAAGAGGDVPPTQGRANSGRAAP
ncbi:MAG: DUF2783 domain-containing protein [Variibacter sp.]|nr:DUF2783 domain-containing protein [Variibacter sp.]